MRPQLKTKQELTLDDDETSPFPAKLVVLLDRALVTPPPPPPAPAPSSDDENPSSDEEQHSD
ncbi:MAG: hypothetical protein ACKVI4_18215 [Actinomycetales bacterium]